MANCVFLVTRPSLSQPAVALSDPLQPSVALTDPPQSTMARADQRQPSAMVHRGSSRTPSDARRPRQKPLLAVVTAPGRRISLFVWYKQSGDQRPAEGVFSALRPSADGHWPGMEMQSLVLGVQGRIAVEMQAQVPGMVTVMLGRLRWGCSLQVSGCMDGWRTTEEAGIARQLILLSELSNL